MMQVTLATCAVLAAGFDWLETLLPFFFVLFWIVSQVFSVLRRLQGGGRQPAPPPLPRQPPLPRFDPAPGQPRPPQPAAEEVGDLRGELEKQIAEFLREAAGDRKPGPAPRGAEPVGQTKPARPTEIIRPQAAGQPARSEKKSEADRRRPQPPRAATSAAPQGERVKIVVPREAVGRTSPPESPERSQAGESVARHVQDVFSRELSHLRGAISGEASSPAGAVPRRVAPTQSEELVHLLRNPATIRQVILLREVLDRPVDRW